MSLTTRQCLINWLGRTGESISAIAYNLGYPHYTYEDQEEIEKQTEEAEWARQQYEQRMYEQAKSEGYYDGLRDAKNEF